MALFENVQYPSANAFTVIIGENGTGKSRLLKQICDLQICIAAQVANPSKRFSFDALLEDSSQYRTSVNTMSVGNIEFSIGTYKYKAEYDEPKPNHSPLFFSINSGGMPAHLLSRDAHYLYLSESGKPTDTPFPIPVVVAVSSSPFDKFPKLDTWQSSRLGAQVIDKYCYLGARPGSSRRNDFITLKFSQLLKALLKLLAAEDKRSNILSSLFDILGLASKFTVSVRFDEYVRMDQSTETLEIKEALRSAQFRNDRPQPEELPEKDIEQLDRILAQHRIRLKALGMAGNFPPQSHDTIELDINGVTQPNLSDYILLAKYDLIRLVDVRFGRQSGSTFRLTDASSGELCMLFNVLGIAGEIQDSAVIVIDEPELSLHPQWQREFLPLLHRVFSEYHGCHFIVATHSSHILSAAPTENCYFVRLERHESHLLSSEPFAHRSADYQLAVAFHSPGFKNEYILSKIIEEISGLADEGDLNLEQEARIERVLVLADYATATDPVRKMANTLRKAIAAVKALQ